MDSDDEKCPVCRLTHASRRMECAEGEWPAASDSDDLAYLLQQSVVDAEDRG